MARRFFSEIMPTKSGLHTGAGISWMAPPRQSATGTRCAGLPDIVSLSCNIATEVFHSMENFFAIFPRYGNNVSTVWITWISGRFRGFLACFPRAVERSTRRPLNTVERDRPKQPRKRRPMKSGSALSRARLGCGVGRGPFSGCEVGDCSRS